MSGAGVPVVEIHGALIADAFVPLLTEPALGGYQQIAYHRRGYAGSTAASGPLSVPEQAADTFALLRHLGISRAHVVGHSYGGAVALQLALDAPDSVHSLALLEPALILGSSGAEYRRSLAQAIESYHHARPAAVVDGMLEARWPAYRVGLDHALPGAFDAAVTAAGAAFEAELPGLLDWQFDATSAGRISQPVLSVVGGESASLSPRFVEAHEWLLTTLPNTEAYVLPRAHHFLQIENPSDLAAALSDFYARHPLVA